MGESDIVKTYHREVGWNLDIAIVSLSNHSNGSHVIGAQNGCRSLATGVHQLSEGAHATFQRVIPLYDQIRRLPDLGHRLLKCTSPRQRRFEVSRARNKCNSRMPQRGQMLDGLPDPILIVDPNVGYARCIWPNVHENQRYLPETQVLKQRFFHAKCKDRDTINPALYHPPH